jgi:hypothetical protein
MAPPHDHGLLTPGTAVEVRCRFDDVWVSGFVVDDLEFGAEPASVSLRRAGDGDVLPATFPATDVRPTGPTRPARR